MRSAHLVSLHSCLPVSIIFAVFRNDDARLLKMPYEVTRHRAEHLNAVVMKLLAINLSVGGQIREDSAIAGIDIDRDLHEIRAEHLDDGVGERIEPLARLGADRDRARVM